MQGCSASQHQELTIVLFGYRAYRVEDIREEWTKDVGDLFLHHLSELHPRFARFAARVDLREIEDVLPPSYLETAGFIDLLDREARALRGHPAECVDRTRLRLKLPQLNSRLGRGKTTQKQKKFPPPRRNRAPRVSSVHP